MLLNLRKRPVKEASLQRALWQWRTALAVLGLMGWTCLLLQQQLELLQFGAAATTADSPPNASWRSWTLPRLCPSPAQPLARACVDKGKGLYKPFRSAVDLLEDDPDDVPPLVRAWRRGLVDFHDIKVADRFRSEDPQYMKLDKLLHMHNGKQQFGPLYNYEFCKYLDDKCLTHDEERCRSRLSCAWCANTSLCVEKGLKNALGQDYCGGQLESNTLKDYNAMNPDNPLHIISRYTDQLYDVEPDAGNQTEASATCEHYLHGIPHMTEPSAHALSMYYHWLGDYFLHWFSTLYGREHEDHVVILQLDPSTTRLGMLSQYGLVSRYECFRFQSEIKNNTCFTMFKSPVITADGGNDFVNLALQRLEIHDERPTESHVGIISRSFKRFLVNEQELLHATLQMNVSAELLLFDTLPFYQQVKALRRTTVLIGMHGSGLVNALYLFSGSVLVQLMPYRTEGGASFFMTFANRADAVYQEWTNPCQQCTVMHWDLLRDDEREDREAILAQGGHETTGNLFYYFWINQETYVAPEEFQRLVNNALSEEYLNPEGSGRQHAPQLVTDDDYKRERELAQQQGGGHHTNERGEVTDPVA